MYAFKEQIKELDQIPAFLQPNISYQTTKKINQHALLLSQFVWAFVSLWFYFLEDKKFKFGALFPMLDTVI